MGAFPLVVAESVAGLLVTQAGCPHLKRHPCKAQISKEQKAGRAAEVTPDLKPTTGPQQNDTTTTRSAECVVVLPFAKVRKCWFLIANRLPRCIVAKLPRNGAGKSEMKVEGEGDQWNWKS